MCNIVSDRDYGVVSWRVVSERVWRFWTKCPVCGTFVRSRSVLMAHGRWPSQTPHGGLGAVPLVPDACGRTAQHLLGFVGAWSRPSGPSPGGAPGRTIPRLGPRGAAGNGSADRY